MAQIDPPAKVASNAQLGLGSEVRHLPTPEELRSYADDADQNRNRWVPISPDSLRGMADEFDRQAAELDRRFGIGGELLIARRERDDATHKMRVAETVLGRLVIRCESEMADMIDAPEIQTAKALLGLGA